MVEHGASQGLQSLMRVMVKSSDDPTVIGGQPLGQSTMWRRVQLRTSQLVRFGFRTANPTLHSIAWPPTRMDVELQRRDSAAQADLIHLHWLGDETLSIEQIGRIRQPKVWTLHDQWAFCGAEHYTCPPVRGESASADQRFVLGYTHASRPAHERGPDLNRLTWWRKRRALHSPFQIVCPSNWLADCARRSALMACWPITVIPYPIDLGTWAPCDQHQARLLLGLPLDRPLVLFGAVGGTTDPRKGAALLLEALQILRAQTTGTVLEHLELVVFGQSCPQQPPNLGFPIHYAGRLADDLSLRLYYAAADVMVVPSMQEAFGQTASEAHACATPVVAFRTGGLVDIVDDGITGALAEPFEPASLAAAIGWVLEDPQRRRQLAAAARRRAEQLWDPTRLVKLYAEVYRKAQLKHEKY
jgi:glycosyltransferase involved in cell wall biosynthesis